MLFLIRFVTVPECGFIPTVPISIADKMTRVLSYMFPIENPSSVFTLECPSPLEVVLRFKRLSPRNPRRLVPIGSTFGPLSPWLASTVVSDA